MTKLLLASALLAALGGLQETQTGPTCAAVSVDPACVTSARPVVTLTFAGRTPLSPPVRAAGQASSRSPRLVTPAAAVDCNMPVITPPESFDSRMPVLKPPPGVNHTMIVRIVQPCPAKR
jgi:hypothetical protein